MEITAFTAKELARLAQTPVFRGLAPARVEALLSGDWERAAFARGETVYGPGQYRRALGVVISGRIRVGKPADDGRDLMISTLGPGNIFGAAALFHAQTDYVTHLTAKEDCRVIFIPEARLLAVFQAEFQAAENYIRYLSDRVLFLNAKIAELSAGSARQRLARYLLETAKPDESGALWADPGSMSALAARLHIGRASLYRALEALEAAGAVEKNGKQLKLADPARLTSTE